MLDLKTIDLDLDTNAMTQVQIEKELTEQIDTMSADRWKLLSLVILPLPFMQHIWDPADPLTQSPVKKYRMVFGREKSKKKK